MCGIVLLRLRAACRQSPNLKRIFSCDPECECGRSRIGWLPMSRIGLAVPPLKVGRYPKEGGGAGGG